MKKMQVMGVLALIVISLVMPVVADTTSMKIAAETGVPVKGPDILLARGDPLDYYTNETDIWYWLFGPVYEPAPLMYGLHNDPNSSTILNESMSQSLTPGDYNILIQSAGNNSVREVYYESGVTANGTPWKNLDSPWKKVKAVSVDGLMPQMVMQRLLKLGNDTEFSDDKFLNFSMSVQDPMIRITDVYETDNDELYIHGLTNAPSGSNVTLILDPDNQVTAKDRKRNSVNVTATGEVNALRQFTGYLPLRWDELSIGMHTVRAINNQGTSMDTQRRISMDWSQPEVTPVPYKYVLSDDGLRKYKFKPTPTPTPQIVYVDRYIEKIIVINVTQNVTAEPTPTPVPTETDVHPLPMFPFIALIATAIGAAFVIVRKKN